MADCHSCKSSVGLQNTTTTDPNKPSNQTETNLVRTFLNDLERNDVLRTKSTSMTSQVSLNDHLGRRQPSPPSVPEENEALNECNVTMKKDGSKGQVRSIRYLSKAGDDFVVLLSENGSVAKVNEELLKDLKTRFAYDDNMQVNTDATQLNQANDSHSNDKDIDLDLRKRRKLMVNRISSKKCRIKKIQRLANMEQHVKYLEDHVKDMKFKIKTHEHNQRLLMSENSLSKVKIAALEERSRLRALEVELNQDEVKRLRVEAECIHQNATTTVEQMHNVTLVDTEYLIHKQSATASMISDSALPNITSTDE